MQCISQKTFSSNGISEQAEVKLSLNKLVSGSKSSESRCLSNLWKKKLKIYVLEELVIPLIAFHKDDNPIASKKWGKLKT